MESNMIVQSSMKATLLPLMTSNSAEHYTPREILNLSIRAMGRIGLDPCADPEHAVPAAHHFTQEDNGLVRDWFDTVFMNPPYGKSIGDWTEKLLREYLSGRVVAAIALLPGRLDTKWFNGLLKARPYICLVRGRLKFSNAENSAPFPSVLVYLGRHGGDFTRVFGSIGPIFTQVRYES